MLWNNLVCLDYFGDFKSLSWKVLYMVQILTIELLNLLKFWHKWWIKFQKFDKTKN
jgi:hypothetical protein